MNSKTEFQILAEFPLLILHPPKPVPVPYTRASGRRDGLRTHWGRVQLQVPCRCSGKVRGGGDHGFYCAVWIQLQLSLLLKAFPWS